MPKLGPACSYSSSSSLRLEPYLTRKPNTVVMFKANNGRRREGGREGGSLGVIAAAWSNRTTHAHFDIRSIDRSSSFSRRRRRRRRRRFVRDASAHCGLGRDVVHYVFREDERSWPGEAKTVERQDNERLFSVGVSTFNDWGRARGKISCERRRLFLRISIL